MQIAEDISKEMYDELIYIAKKIAEENDIYRKLYFLSASYGLTNRVLRASFSKEILLADLVFNQCYQQLNHRWDSIKKGDKVVSFDINIFSLLGQNFVKLADKIKNNEDFYDVLEDMLTISFSVSGFGNYLKEKDMLKIK